MQRYIARPCCVSILPNMDISGHLSQWPCVGELFMGIVFVFTRCLIKKIPDVFPCNSNICSWILIFIGWIVSQNGWCNNTQHHVDIQAMWWWVISPSRFFAVYDPLPLTRWINCSFSNDIFVNRPICCHQIIKFNDSYASLVWKCCDLFIRYTV